MGHPVNEDRGPSSYESVYPLVERLQDQVNALNMELQETKQNLETIKAAHDQKQHEVDVLKEEKKYSQHHFGVVQNAYGFTKDAWKWGKNVPVLSDVLGLTEGVTEGLLDMILHMDLTAIDQDIFFPNMKRLDDDVITPALRSICEVTLAAQNEERKQLEENMRQLFSENQDLKSSNKDLAVKLNGLAAVARLRIMQQKLEAQKLPAGGESV
jgi:regulator of replication initiation timing